MAPRLRFFNVTNKPRAYEQILYSIIKPVRNANTCRVAPRRPVGLSRGRISKKINA